MKPDSLRTLIIIAGMLVVAGCATQPQQWEYRTRTTDNPKGKAVLNNYGKGGWELVDYSCRPKDETGTNFIYQYVFKRPKN